MIILAGKAILKARLASYNKDKGSIKMSRCYVVNFDSSLEKFEVE